MAWRCCSLFGESRSYLLARNSPKTVRPAGIGAMLQLLSRERLSWVLSLFYFLTFGGFVAFSIYLPVLLKDQFGLKPADAGFRTAGFVVLATLARPLGGWLADKIGGARVLHVVFPRSDSVCAAHVLAGDAAVHGWRAWLRLPAW